MKKEAAVNVKTIVSEPFAENSYVVWRAGSPLCLVVDPGFEPELILDLMKEQKLTPAAILNTHGHVDHIAGNGAMKQVFPDAPLVIGGADAIMLTDPYVNMSASYGMPITSPPADRTLNDGDKLELAGMMFDVWEIPGHSPGHIVFYLKDAGILLGGDVLFQGSVGRTDFPGGSMTQLALGIRRKLWPLPKATIVYPGHGEPTTIGEEKRSNPFVAGDSDR